MQRFFKSIATFAIIFGLCLQLTVLAYGETISTIRENITTETVQRNIEQNEMQEVDLSQTMILSEDENKREEYIKHYITEDKSYVAAIYDNPVHYKDENGNWLDYDNSLIETENENKEKIYKNKSSDVSITFAEKANKDEIVSIEKNGYKLSWGFVDKPVIQDNNISTSSLELAKLNDFSKKETVNGTSIAVKDEKTRESKLEKAKKENNIKEYNQQYTLLENLTSTVKYENVFEKTNIEYSIVSNTLKENIKLTSRDAPNEFCFMVNHKGLNAELREDGKIYFTKDNEIIFLFDLPYAYDANEKYTYDVEFSLQALNECSLVTLTLDKEWLDDPNRAFPVVIDPVTQTVQSVENIHEAFVSSSFPNQCVGENGSLAVGEENSEGTCYTYVKFNSLPALGKGDVIVSANISLVQFANDGSFNGFSADPASITELVTKAYEVTNSWQENTITYNNKPDNDPTVLDYNVITAHDDYVAVSYDVTKLMRKWYNDGHNYGIVIKGDVPSGKKVIARFLSSNYSTSLTDVYPFGTICYRNATGLENYWNYQTQSVGSSATGYVNTFNGNLVFTHQLASTSGTLSPASVGLVYNLSECTKNTNYGDGWRLSAVQRVDENTDEEWGNEYPYYYTDGDGTKHYFYNNNGTYNDEDGLGLTYTAVTETSNGVTIKHKITTKDGCISKFDSNGYLREFIDTKNRVTKYTYTSGKLTSITDPANQTISFTYNSSGKLVTVTDDVGRTASCIYDSSDYLETVTYLGYTTEFLYSGGKLTYVKNPQSNSISYEYSTDCGSPRVSKITVMGQNGTTVGSSIALSYSTGMTTTITDPGLDGNYSTSDDNIYTYNFDKFGRCNDIYDEEGNANTYKYYSNQTGSNIKKNNSLLTSGSTQKTVYNYLKNSNFDETFSTSNWSLKTFNNATDCEIYRATQGGLVGLRALMITSTSSTVNSGAAQVLTLQPGEYTFSAYVRAVTLSTEANNGFVLGVYDVNDTEVASRVISQPTDVNIDNGWERVSVTFTVDEIGLYYLFCGLRNYHGNVLVKCAQLEKGEAANKYNIVLNSGFESDTSKWTHNKENTSSGVGAISKTTDAELNSSVLKMPGILDEWSSVTQTINISGNEGDVFALSAWTKAYAKTGSEEATENNPKYAIEAEVCYTDGTSKKETFDCNPDVTGWQFVTGCISTDDNNSSTTKQYSSIKINLCYDYQINEAYFDGIQLIKDNAQSYVYDDEGNLVSTTDAVNDMKYSYDGNSNITHIQNPTGTSYDYLYDSKQNMINAVDSYGTQYSIAYDTNSNPVSESYWSKHETTTNSSTPSNDKSYYIKSVSTGEYLTVTNNSINDGASVNVENLNKNESQKFMLHQSGSNSYILIPNHAENKMICYTESSLNAKQKNLSYTEKEGQFIFKKDSSTGNYTIKSSSSSKLLAIVNGVVKFVASTETGDHVLWKLEACGNHIDTQYTYNTSGTLLTGQEDTFGESTTYAYDSKNRLQTTTNAKGNTTTYTYTDGTELLDTVTAQNGNSQTSIQYVYSNSKLSGIRRNGTRIYSFQYDTLGNLNKTLVGSNVLSTNTYSQKTGLLTGVTYGNGATTGYVYDNNYNLVGKKYGGVEKFSYAYDGYGNLSSKKDLVNNVNYRYTYDLIGRLVGMMSTNGIKLSRSYDEFSRVNKTVANVNGTITTTEFIYGNSAEGEYQDGIYGVELDGNQILSYNYDGLGRMTYKYLNCGSASLTSTYTYKAGEKPDATSYLVQSYNNNVDLYYHLYDELGNITQISNTTTGITNTYEYDDLNQLVCEHNEELNKTIRYTYDNNGNLLSKSEYALNASATATPTVTYTYGYDDASWQDKMTSYKGSTITYDAIGNPLTYKQGVTFTWQNGRQMATATRNGKNLSFKYDDNGIRTEKVSVFETSTTITNTTKYYYDGSTLLAQEMVSSTGTTTRFDFFYDDKGDVLGFKYNGANYFYVKNLQGDVTDIVDSTGTVVVSYTYDTWGVVKSTTGTMKSTIGNNNPFRYRSYYYDTDLALYYLNSRYYDPYTGRFVNADNQLATGDMTGMNLFAYCGNNPVNKVDPYGHFAFSLVGAIGGAIVGGFCGGIKAAIQGKSVLSGVFTGAVTGAACGAITGALVDATVVTGGMVLVGVVACASVATAGDIANQYLNYQLEKPLLNYQNTNSNSKSQSKFQSQSDLTSTTEQYIDPLSKSAVAYDPKYESFSNYIDWSSVAKSAVYAGIGSIMPNSVTTVSALSGVTLTGVDAIGISAAYMTIEGTFSIFQTCIEIILE